MGRWTTLSFTTDSVTAGGGTWTNDRDISANFVNIGKVKVTPSESSGSTTIALYKRSTCLAADEAYLNTFSSLVSLVDPVEDISGTQTERNQGFVTPYEDLDDGLHLHVKITNNGSVDKTYDVTIEYDSVYADLASTASGKGDALIGYKRTVASALASTLHAWHEDQPLDVKTDYGAATGNTAAANTTAIAAADTAAGITGFIYIPEGTFKVNDLTLISHVICDGNLEVQSGKTLTMPIPQAGLHQIFSGSGSVSLTAFGKIYPQWFGAVANGLTDDSNAIQKAHDSLPSYGGIISFARGTGSYLVASKITISKINVIFANDGWSGPGFGVTIQSSGSLSSILEVQNQGFKMIGIILQGDGSLSDFGKTATVDGIRYTGALSADGDSLIAQSDIYLCHQAILTNVKNVEMVDSFITACAHGWKMDTVAGNDLRGHIIQNCRFHSMARGAIAIESTGAGANQIKIQNNYWDGGGSQFFKGAIHDLLLQNNHLYRRYGSGDIIDFDGGILGIITDNLIDSQALPVTLTRSGTTATATAATSTNVETGDSITITGSSHAEYNGTFTATKVDASSFTYTMTGDPGASDSGTFLLPGDGVSVNGSTYYMQVAGNHIYRVGGNSISMTGAIKSWTDDYDTTTGIRTITAPLAIGSASNGQSTIIKQETVQSGPMSGGTVTLTDLVPAGSIVMGITVHPTTGITSGDGGSTYTVDDEGSATSYATGVAFASDVNLTNQAITGPKYYTAAKDILIKCDGGKTFNGGVVRVTVHYITLTAATG